MASSKMMIPLETTSTGLALQGYTGHVYAVPAGTSVVSTYPLTEDSNTPGLYYRDAMTHGLYDIYVDSDKSGSPIAGDLKIEDYEHGVVDATVTTDKIVDSSVTGDKIANDSVSFNQLTQACRDQVGADTITNNPDDVYLATNASSQISLKEAYQKRWDGDSSLDAMKKVGVWDHLVNNNVINVKDFGAVGDGTTDDTTAIQDAIDYCTTNYNTTNARSHIVSRARVVAEGNFKITSTITLTCEADFRNAHFIVPDAFTSTALKVEASDGASYLQLHQTFLPEISTTQSLTWAYDNTGIQMTSLSESTVFISSVSYFRNGIIATTWASKGFVYNNIFLKTIIENKIGLTLTHATSGWTNENNWYGGRYAISAGFTSYSGTVLIKITGNNNVFYKPSVEGDNDETKFYFDGTVTSSSYNAIISPRFERSGSASRIYADGANVSMNVFRDGYVHTYETEITYATGTSVPLNAVNFEFAGNKVIAGDGNYGVYRLMNMTSDVKPILAFFSTGSNPQENPTDVISSIWTLGYEFKNSASATYPYVKADYSVEGVRFGRHDLDISTAPYIRSYYSGGWYLDINGDGQPVKVTNGNLELPTNAYDSNLLVMNGNYLWVDSSGDLRIKSSAPTSDTDGTKVGAQ